MAFWGQKLRPGQSGKNCQMEEFSTCPKLVLGTALRPERLSCKSRCVARRTISAACRRTSCSQDGVASQTLDLFFAPGETSFLCKGTHELHVSGYIEPEDADEEEGLAHQQTTAEDHKATKRKPNDDGTDAQVKKDGLHAVPAEEA
eukprot:4007313-Amphidinium_carterae.1